MTLKKCFSLEEPLITQVTILKLVLFSSVCHHVLLREESLFTHITFYNMFFHVLLQILFIFKSSGAMVTGESFVFSSHMIRQVSHYHGTVMAVVAAGIVAGKTSGSLAEFTTELASFLDGNSFPRLCWAGGQSYFLANLDAGVLTLSSSTFLGKKMFDVNLESRKLASTLFAINRSHHSWPWLPFCHGCGLSLKKCIQAV